MERLTLKQARERVAENVGAAGLVVHDVRWMEPDREALLIAGLLPGARGRGSARPSFEVEMRLVSEEREGDGLERVPLILAIGPPDAVVKPGDRIQDMEAKHRDGRHRVMRVDRIVSKDGRPYAECSHAIAGRPGTRVRLDRIHRKNIQTGWRVLDAAEGR